MMDQNIQVTDVDGKKIIVIEVPEAERQFKPVYINARYEYSYIRKGDGDYKMTDVELRAMLRNSQPVDDALYVEDIGLEGLDFISVASFKEKISARYPQKKFEKYTPQEFLERIGAIKIDSADNIKIKNGTLLFFGKYEVIKEKFPSYFVDYINRLDPAIRWIDRVTSDDINDVHMNIYNFFNIVFEKMRAIVVEKFQLGEDSIREKSSGFEIAIREALTNCLAHADYFQGFPTIKVEASKGWFLFRNPGEMLVSVDQFMNGGDSRPRNETIMSFFRYLGVSERQGEGGPSIYRTALENDYRLPEVKTDLESTELRIWYIDLVESHPELAEDEKKVYHYLYKHGPVAKFVNIQEAVGLTEYKLRKALDSLIEQKLITKAGNSRATCYGISDSDHFFTQLKFLIDKIQHEL